MVFNIEFISCFYPTSLSKKIMIYYLIPLFNSRLWSKRKLANLSFRGALKTNYNVEKVAELSLDLLARKACESGLALAHEKSRNVAKGAIKICYTLASFPF